MKQRKLKKVEREQLEKRVVEFAERNRGQFRGRYELIDVCQCTSFPDYWGVFFNVYSEEGDPLEGGWHLMIHKETGEIIKDTEYFEREIYNRS